ncbi:MAG: hypothetical protein M8861_09420, partial [marine benthic group bacterium]|nr:hypothetical protein [Gemmatimonadota bacterium]
MHNAADAQASLEAVLKDEIIRMYEEVADDPTAEFHFYHGRQAAELFGYDPELLDRAPAGAVDSFARVPFRVWCGIDMAAGYRMGLLCRSHDGRLRSRCLAHFDRAAGGDDGHMCSLHDIPRGFWPAPASQPEYGGCERGRLSANLDRVPVKRLLRAYLPGTTDPQS